MIFEGINIEEPFFDDMEPEPKSSDELALLILKDSAGKDVDLRKYSEEEINKCARKLIIDGYLRGTVIDWYKCCWSKITRKGQFLIDYLESKENFDYI